MDPDWPPTPPPPPQVKADAVKTAVLELLDDPDVRQKLYELLRD
jgi:hypothetical protein